MEARRTATTSPEAFRLALRVRHPSMDPAELSRAFGIEPEYSFRAGSVRPSRSAAKTASVHPESYWLGELSQTRQALDQSFPGALPLAGKPLEAARNSLSWALSLACMRVLRPHVELLRRIRSEGGAVSLLVTIYTSDVGDFNVPPEASRACGDLGIAIEFELAGY